MGIRTKNRLLRQAVENVEANLEPKNRQNYDRLVTAGMQAAVDKDGGGILAGIVKYKDPVQAAAVGAVQLVFMLRGHATGKVPEQAMIPAAYTLMMQALAFIEDAKLAKIGPDEITWATRVWMNTVFTRFGIPPAALERQKKAAEGIINNPARLERLHLLTGYTVDPRAPRPMEEPAAPPPKMNRRARRAAARGRG